MTWIPGEPLDHSMIHRGRHAAETLAEFLRALHVEAPADAPVATDRGAHPGHYTVTFENYVQTFAPEDIAAALRSIWNDAVGHPRGPAHLCGRTATPIQPTLSSPTEPSRA
ncbi:hypothetical protein DFR74_11818 [Nocardia puris]|uniref:Uncharacterized protein n=1 Tax=Nocardia puris TaxID=208602 RepID=A0A366D2D5_9NOCA|nr:hypothetical protein DFR74_11818 [Nocardia puris]